MPIEHDNKRQRNPESSGASNTIDPSPPSLPFHPRAPLVYLSCRLLRSTHVFPGIGQGMRFAIRCLSLPASFLFFRFLSVLTDTGIPRAGGIGEAKGGGGKASRKKRWKKKECIKDGRAFSRRSIHAAARALWNAVRAIREITISPLSQVAWPGPARLVGRTDVFVNLDYSHGRVLRRHVARRQKSERIVGTESAARRRANLFVRVIFLRYSYTRATRAYLTKLRGRGLRSALPHYRSCYYSPRSSAEYLIL